MPDAPWIVAWEGECHYDVRPCPFAGGKPALWQTEAPGQGKPLFEQLHIVRSRRAVWEWLCPLCGEPTDTDDRFWFGKGKADLGRGDGSTWGWATSNAPNHRRCAETAAEACPHLSQHYLHPLPFPPPDAIVAGNLTQVGPSISDTGFVLLPGQTIIGQLFFVWQAKPRGAL